MEKPSEIKLQEEKENLLTPWVEQIKDIYNQILPLSKTQRRKRFEKIFADEFERLSQDRETMNELFFWEEMRDLFHNSSITDYGVVRDDFIKKRMEENK